MDSRPLYTEISYSLKRRRKKNKSVGREGKKKKGVKEWNGRGFIRHLSEFFWGTVIQLICSIELL